MHSFCDGDNKAYSCMETAVSLQLEKLILAVSGYAELCDFAYHNRHKFNKKH